AVLENLPRIPLVFDHFHVVKLMNDKLTEVRRKLHRELKDTMGNDVLKGTRWLLLKNPENLNADRDEQQHLEEDLRQI
ncbi:transposase, partial [Maridesulfovibrio bastinii]